MSHALKREWRLISATACFILGILVAAGVADEPTKNLTAEPPKNALEFLEAEILRNQEKTKSLNVPRPQIGKPPIPKASPPIVVQEELPTPPESPDSSGTGLAPRTTNAPSIDAPPLIYLGLTLQKPNGNLLGLRVVAVADRSPAWKSGFLVSDRVIAVADQAISSIEEFADSLAGYGPGDAIRFLIDRSGRKKEVVCVLTTRDLADRLQPDQELLSNTLPRRQPNNSQTADALSTESLRQEVIQLRREVQELRARLQDAESR